MNDPGSGQPQLATPPSASGRIVADYWTRHNVTQHRAFSSPEESLSYFQWRIDQYFSYIKLMPVCSQNNKVVLDYGCGPGHDLVGFGVYSKPRKLFGVDVSSSSLNEARARLALHGIEAELILLDPSSACLPIETA
jgi:SAM-dependent methyltransferase